MNHTYPANASIYLGFLLGLVSEHLVAAVSLVFLVPLVVAVYGLGRATKADENASLLASLGLLTIPIIAFGAFNAGADVGGCAFLAVAIYFVVAKRDNRPSYLVLSGLAAGLAFGFKSLHLVSIVFLFILILLRAWFETRNTTLIERLWSIFRPAVIFSIAVFIISGYWLVRNYVQLGNPLYPVYLPIFDIFAWKKAPDFNLTQRAIYQYAWVSSPIDWLVYPWVEWRSGGVSNNFQADSGLGAFFAATVPVACLASLIGLIKKKGEERQTLIRLLGGGVFVIFIWWILDDHEPRFLMGALVFLVPLVAWTMGLTKGRSRTIFDSIVGICILIMLLVIFSKQFVVFGREIIYARQFTRQVYYGYPEMIDQLPPGSTVVNFGRRTSNYALYGKTHQNRVVSYVQAYRLLGPRQQGKIPEEAPQIGHLAFSTLRKLNATHLFTVGYPRLSLDERVQLREIDRMDKIPILGKPLTKPSTLYEIIYYDGNTSKF